MLMQKFNINYKNVQATLILSSYVFVKNIIGLYSSWNVLPMLSFQDSMSVNGIIIYNQIKEEKFINIENLEAYDYESTTAIGSVSYKIYNSPNIETSENLLLTIKLDPMFASKLNHD